MNCIYLQILYIVCIDECHSIGLCYWVTKFMNFVTLLIVIMLIHLITIPSTIASTNTCSIPYPGFTPICWYCCYWYSCCFFTSSYRYCYCYWYLYWYCYWNSYYTFTFLWWTFLTCTVCICMIRNDMLCYYIVCMYYVCITLLL